MRIMKNDGDDGDDGCDGGAAEALVAYSVGTGKTHTPYPRSLHVLVCSASNLAADDILERLLALLVPKSESRLKVTWVGHPVALC